MIEKNVQMMDAGMRLFETEKPFGTVLGGIKTELARYGKVYRTNEFRPEEMPELTEDCDLFLDWSSIFRTRYLSCKLEDAGLAGRTEDGEEIHRYAAFFREGGRNKPLHLVSSVLLLIILFGTFLLHCRFLPKFVIILVVFGLGLMGIYNMLRPSKKGQELISRILDTFQDAK